MKSWKLPPLITLTISAQMIVSPIVYAEGINPLQIVNQIGSVIQQNQANMQAQIQAQANQQMVAQMTAPGEDKYFKDSFFSRIPGLYQYMGQNGLGGTLNCTTLPTTLTEVKAEVCRIGVTNDRGVPPQAQLAEMFSLYKTYGDVSKAYENYSATSNAQGQGFGVGCMNNALQVLNGFLTSRINDLDKLMQNVSFINDQFKTASKIDLDAIAESTAVLDGGNNELVDEVKTKKPDLFDFGKRFNNPACKSMYEGDKINTLGRRSPGGLNAISKDMRTQFSAKTGKFSGESYVGAHASVIEDINKMADNVSKQFNLNFSAISEPGAEGRGGYGQFLSSLPGSVSSPNGLASQFTRDFFADAQQSYNTEISKINSDFTVLSDEMRAAGVDPTRAASVARNLNGTNFENEVTAVQNQLRNGCLQRSFSGANYWNDLKRNIKDPEASKSANKTYSNFRDRIQAIMTDSRTTPEAKLEAVRSLEATEGSRFVLNMQGGYQTSSLDAQGNVVKKNVSASSSTPSSFFSNVITNCDAQFSTNKLGSTLTAASALQKLRNLNQQYKTLASNQSNKLRSEIRRKMIECSTPTDANASVAGSCTPDKFNTSSPGFCANGAFTCANNMKSCTTQAEALTNQIKTERTARVNKYKANMEKNKADIKNMLGKVFGDYSQLGSALAGMNLGAGFNFPSPDLNVTGEYMDKFRAATQNSPDGALLLEDPDKYVELMRKNVTKLRDAFTQMQNSLTGRGGALAQHIEQTKNNYRVAKDKAENASRECIAKHDDYIRQSEQQRAQQMAEQQKKQNELGERQQEFCERYSMIDSNPDAACEGQTRSLVGSALRAASMSGDSANYERAQAATNYYSTRCQQNGVNNPSAGSNTSAIIARQAQTTCASAVGPIMKPGSNPQVAYTDAELRALNPQNLTAAADRVKVLCWQSRDREYCQGTPSTVTNPPAATAGATAPQPTVSNSCKDDLYIAINAASGNGNPSITTGEGRASVSDTGGAPAFCDAGNNSDRSVNPTDFAQQLIQTASGNGSATTPN